jgi:DNA-binding MarR family transcriptional regulator
MTDRVDTVTDNTHQTAMLLLGIARKAIGSSLDIVKKEGLRPPQALFLIEILERGPVTMGEMAADTKVHPTVVTRFMDRMTRKGFVARTRGKDDRRIVRIELTDKGRKTADKMLRNYLSRVEQALAGASRREKDAFLTLLTLIDDSLSQ